MERDWFRTIKVKLSDEKSLAQGNEDPLLPVLILRGPWAKEMKCCEQPRSQTHKTAPGPEKPLRLILAIIISRDIIFCRVKFSLLPTYTCLSLDSSRMCIYQEA